MSLLNIVDNNYCNILVHVKPHMSVVFKIFLPLKCIWVFPENSTIFLMSSLEYIYNELVLLLEKHSFLLLSSITNKCHLMSQ